MTELQFEELIIQIDQFVEELEADYEVSEIRNALAEYIDILDEVL